MFDITTKAVGSTGDCLLNDTDDTPLIGEAGKQCSITAYSPGSAEYQAVQTKKNNSNIERLRKKGSAALTPEAERRQIAEFLADVTISFNHFTYPGEFESDRDRFVAAYMDTSIGFIRDQFNAWLGEWGNFKQASAKK